MLRLTACRYEQSTNCIVLYCIVSIHLYSASCSAHQSEALPMRETQREESSLERTKYPHPETSHVLVTDCHQLPIVPIVLQSAPIVSAADISV